MAKQDKLPGVLSFRRGMNVSDGKMLNIFKTEDGETHYSNIKVMRSGILGTQNVNKDEEKEVANPIITESAKTDEKAVGFAVDFIVDIMPIDSIMHICSGKLQAEFRESYNQFIEKAKTTTALTELSKRYARNIANARFLHRNRSIGNRIEVVVEGDEEGSIIFDSKKIPLHHFEDISEEEGKLALWIERRLRGERDNAIKVTAKSYFDHEVSMQVYPSQNYVKNTPTGFSRSLYKTGESQKPVNNDEMRLTDQLLVGNAALRDSKIANALRTIDTWYPEFEDTLMPIPVEPLGANLQMHKFFRPYKDQNNNAFGIIKRLDEIDPEEDRGLYMLAALLRGGVYGESDK